MVRVDVIREIKWLSLLMTELRVDVQYFSFSPLNRALR